jgi:quercetin dioxygenase-like cupin family protein
MDRSDAPFRRCTGNATEAQRVVRRRTVLLGAAKLAVLASVRSGFAQAPAEKDSTTGRNATMDIKRNGSRQSGKGPEAWFTGTVRVDPLFQVGDPARLSGGQVTFEPGARTMWHTHPLGQTLIVTSGLGWVQCVGGPIEEIRPGDVVWFPPGEKHWHGATATTAMTHIAITESLNGKNVDWMEKVTDAQYRR